nr:hypothetical protein [Tanacetum cinerariifolium]
PRVKFCAGECGLRSWEWCGGGGVGWKVGESGVKGMAGKPGSGATVPAILNVGDEKYYVGLGTLHVFLDLSTKTALDFSRILHASRFSLFDPVLF